MDIRDQKLIQLFRKTSSSQVNSRSLRVMQQSIGDVTCVGYTSIFWEIMKFTLAFLAKT